MLIEGGLAFLAFLAWRKAGEKGAWTTQREEMFQSAMEHLKHPEKLRKLADILEKHGFAVKAYAARKRADLRDADSETKAKRAEALKKGLESKNPDAILKLAAAFESVTATGAAKRLRKHAAEMRIALAQAERERQIAEDGPDRANIVNPDVSTMYGPRETEVPEAPITEDELPEEEENKADETEVASLMTEPLPLELEPDHEPEELNGSSHVIDVKPTLPKKKVVDDRV